MADVVHDNSDIGASIASGSFRARGMVIAPCSMKSLAEVANGVADNLIARAADVMLKERRRLVLMARETPLHAGHVRNMALATENGAIIAPPVPAFYARPLSLDEMVTHSCGRILDLFDIDLPETARWGDAYAQNHIPVTGKPRKTDYGKNLKLKLLSGFFDQAHTGTQQIKRLIAFGLAHIKPRRRYIGMRRGKRIVCRDCFDRIP